MIHLKKYHPTLSLQPGLNKKVIFLANQKLTLSLTLFLYLDESELQPVYGGSLEDHLRIQEREIAFVIEECVTFLYKTAMSVQVSPLFILLFLIREQIFPFFLYSETCIKRTLSGNAVVSA